MKTDILLRAYTMEGLQYLEQVASLIRTKTTLKVQLIDHTELSWADFDFEDGSSFVSLDRVLSDILEVPYFQISRIFDKEGYVVGRHEKGDFFETGEQVCILDIDMVQGKTIQLACRRFYTSQYSIPILVGSQEELINIEDLMHPLSLLQREKGGEMEMCSYLLNETFFTRVTGLPVTLYADFCKLFRTY